MQPAISGAGHLCEDAGALKSEIEGFVRKIKDKQAQFIKTDDPQQQEKLRREMQELAARAKEGNESLTKLVAEAANVRKGALAAVNDAQRAATDAEREQRDIEIALSVYARKMDDWRRQANWVERLIRGVASQLPRGRDVDAGFGSLLTRIMNLQNVPDYGKSIRASVQDAVDRARKNLAAARKFTASLPKPCDNLSPVEIPKIPGPRPHVKPQKQPQPKPRHKTPPTRHPPKSNSGSDGPTGVVVDGPQDPTWDDPPTEVPFTDDSRYYEILPSLEKPSAVHGPGPSMAQSGGTGESWSVPEDEPEDDPEEPPVDVPQDEPRHQPPHEPVTPSQSHGPKCDCPQCLGENPRNDPGPGIVVSADEVDVPSTADAKDHQDAADADEADEADETDDDPAQDTDEMDDHDDSDE